MVLMLTMVVRVVRVDPDSEVVIKRERGQNGGVEGWTTRSTPPSVHQ